MSKVILEEPKTLKDNRMNNILSHGFVYSVVLFLVFYFIDLFGNGISFPIDKAYDFWYPFGWLMPSSFILIIAANYIGKFGSESRPSWHVRNALFLVIIASIFNFIFSNFRIINYRLVSGVYGANNPLYPVFLLISTVILSLAVLLYWRRHKFDNELIQHVNLELQENGAIDIIEINTPVNLDRLLYSISIGMNKNLIKDAIFGNYILEKSDYECTPFHSITNYGHSPIKKIFGLAVLGAGFVLFAIFAIFAYTKPINPSFYNVFPNVIIFPAITCATILTGLIIFLRDMGQDWLEKNTYFHVMNAFKTSEPKEIRNTAQIQYYVPLEWKKAEQLKEYMIKISHLDLLKDIKIDVSNIKVRFATEEPEITGHYNKVIIRRYHEHKGGFIILKIRILNKTDFMLSKIRYKLEIPKSYKLHNATPKENIKGAVVEFKDLPPKEEKSVQYTLEPLICGKEHFYGNLEFLDHEGNQRIISMKDLKIEVICPLFFTEEDANIARLKNLMNYKLKAQDERGYLFLKKLEPQEAFKIMKNVIKKHHVKFVGEVVEIEGPFEAHAWFYGKSKVHKDEFVIQAIVSEENESMKIKVACENEPELTGFLSELGSNFKQEIVKIGLITSEYELISLRCPECSAPLNKYPKFGKTLTCEYCGTLIKRD